MSKEQSYKIKGNKLREIRISKFFTLQEFCNEFNKVTGRKLDMTSLSKFESWKRKPWIKIINAFKEYLWEDFEKLDAKINKS